MAGSRQHPETAQLIELLTTPTRGHSHGVSTQSNHRLKSRPIPGTEYCKAILPFTLLRRLDCVLETTREAILAEQEKREKAKLNPDPFMLKKSGHHFPSYGQKLCLSGVEEGGVLRDESDAFTSFRPVPKGARHHDGT